MTHTFERGTIIRSLNDAYLRVEVYKQGLVQRRVIACTLPDGQEVRFDRESLERMLKMLDSD